MMGNGIKINTKKTIVIKTSQGDAELNRTMGGEQVKQVHKFQYLGVQFNA